MTFNPFKSLATQQLINGRIKELGIDVKKLCDRVGMHTARFTKYQEDVKAPVGIDKMTKLASLLGIEFDIHFTTKKIDKHILRSIQKENAHKENYGFTSARKEMDDVMNTKPLN